MAEHQQQHPEAVFAAALEIVDLVARAAYVEQTCGADNELRREVGMLLAAHAGAEHWLPWLLCRRTWSLIHLIVTDRRCPLGRRTDAAQSELAQGREIIESNFRSGLGPGENVFGRWFDWLIARILLREATSFIDGQPAGSAKQKPDTSTER